MDGRGTRIPCGTVSLIRGDSPKGREVRSRSHRTRYRGASHTPSRPGSSPHQWVHDKWDKRYQTAAVGGMVWTT